MGGKYDQNYQEAALAYNQPKSKGMLTWRTGHF